MSSRLRRHRWSPRQRAVLIGVVAVIMGSLFVTTYSLALGDPVPHHIDAALIGNPAANPRAIAAAETVADDKLAFEPYRSVPAALTALDNQDVYAALDVAASRPTLYVASAVGVSVARVLEKISVADPRVRVVDTHPLADDDPNGLDVFYLMLVATIVGMVTVFQVRGKVPELPLRDDISFVVGLAVLASTVLTLVDGPLLHRPAARYPEEWGILAVHVLAVSSFASLMTVLVRAWAIVPTWLFFVILGNASSGGAVAPPLLPQPFAFVSQWLPSGATVGALRNAIYFRHSQQARPLVVLGIWAVVLFAAWIILARRRQAQAMAPENTSLAGGSSSR
jgi:hypothetical protein